MIIVPPQPTHIIGSLLLVVSVAHWFALLFGGRGGVGVMICWMPFIASWMHDSL